MPDRPPRSAVRPQPGAASSRPLLVTRDASLLDDVLRLAAVAGVEVDVSSEAGAAGRSWAAAPLVVVGADAAGDVIRLGLPRRDDVVLVGSGDAEGTWQQGVALGAQHVVFLPAAEAWLASRLGEAAEGQPDLGTVVSTIGGSGGAGASTLAAALAVTAAREGWASMLIDADPFGGGIDLAVGAENASGLRWGELSSTRGRIGPSALRGALPRIGEVCVLSCDRGEVLEVPAPAMESVLVAARRGSDVVVVDLPRRLDPAAELALARSDVTLLVVPSEVRAVAAAARVAAVLRPLAREVRVVVRRSASGSLPPACVPEALGLPGGGVLANEKRLAETLEVGNPPAGRGRGPLAQFCRSFLAGLESRVAA